MRFHEPLLSAADEAALARDIEAGVLAEAVLLGLPGAPDVVADPAELRALVERGERARERFLLANCRLVMDVAQETARRAGLSADELFQEGFLGLAEAVDRFDHRRGLRFATFALHWIRKLVLDAAATRCGSAHVPAWRLRRGERTGLPLAVALEVDGRELPLPDAGAEARLREVDQPTPDPFRHVHDLPALEREVLLLRYGGEGLTQREVAARLGLGATSVRRIEATALGRLRVALQVAAA